jgi:hypothetical protein
MVRGIVIGICAGLFLVVNAAGALACDTSSWLQLGGAANPGSAVTVRGGGLEPGPLTVVWDRSGGQVVGEGSVAADGSVEIQVGIPAAATGRHKIIAVSAGAGDSPVDLHAWTDVVLPGPAVTPRPAAVPAGEATAGISPTGQAALGLGALMIAVAGLAVRRRRAAGGGAGVTDPLDAELQTLLDERRDEPASAGAPTHR